MLVEKYASGRRLKTDSTLTWANSSVVNTTKSETYKKTATNVKEHEIIIANQSANTALCEIS